MVDAYDYDHAVAGQGRLIDALKALVAVDPLDEEEVHCHHCWGWRAFDKETKQSPLAHEEGCPWAAAKRLIEEWER